MPNTVKLKRGTATQWAANNPVLASGEVGVELSVSGSPQALKIGNGTSTWNALPYFIKAGGVPQPIAYGNAGAAGTSVEYARADHIHAVSGFATPSDIEEVYDELRTWGKNLIVNGYGELEDTTNFPGAILQPQLFDPLDASVSIFGFFRGSTGAQVVYDCTEYIAVDSYIPYKWSIFMRGLNGAGGTNKAYMGFRCYTKGKSLIDYYKVPHQALSAAEKLDGMRLTEDWNPNDDHIHIDSAAKWMYRINKTQYLYSGFIRIKSFVEDGIDYGFEYMTHHYTNMWANTTTDPGDGSSWVDLTNNIVHLRSPRGGATVFPAGTKLDCTYKPTGWGLWVVLNETITDNDWVERNGIIEPGDLYYFHSGTYFIKPMIMCPTLSSLPNSGVAVKNFEFRCIKSDQGDVRRTIEEERPDEDYLNANVRELTNSQAGIASQLLYLLNNSNSNNTGASIDFGFSTSANYYHASIRAIRTNVGGAHASKLEFMLRRAIAGVGKTFLESLFSLYYDNTTPYASLEASLGVKITGNPTEAIDVKGNLRLRDMETTAGTVFLEADANGVFRQRTKSEFIGDLGVAPLAHHHNESYISLTGEQTLTDNTDKSGKWVKFAQLEITNDSFYRKSAELCAVLHMQSYSDTREPQEMFNVSVYMVKRGWSSDVGFQSEEPILQMLVEGRHDLDSSRIAALVTDTNSFTQVISFYIRLTASNKSYRTKVLTSKGISYNVITGRANEGNVTIEALQGETPLSTLPTPVVGSVTTPTLITSIGTSSDEYSIHRRVKLFNQHTSAGNKILQLTSAGLLTVRTFAQTISDMVLLTISHDALFDVHGRITRLRFEDLAQESDELGKLAWLKNEKRMAYGLNYGGKDGVWQYLGITKVYPTVNDLMSEHPNSEGIIACALTERIAFVSYWTGSDYQYRPLVNEGKLFGRNCLPWASLPSSPSDGHFQISHDKDVISFYYSTGGWQHLPVDSDQRISSPDDDYTIDPILDKLILVNCSNDDVIITMPVIAQSMGREFIIRYHKGENTVTIIGQSANTVDGLNSITLTTEKDFVRLINDGYSDWCLVGGAYS